MVSDPDAPWLSLTVTVIVTLRGRRTMYVCPALIVPWVEVLPVVVEPSPFDQRTTRAGGSLTAERSGTTPAPRPDVVPFAQALRGAG